VLSILEFVARGNGVSVLPSLAVPERQAGLVFRSAHAAHVAARRPLPASTKSASRRRRWPSGRWRARRPPRGAAERESAQAQNRGNESPPRLQNLVAEGLIDSVVRQLKSGKEADVYVVRCGEETCAAKVYKEANKRGFRQAVDYTENRKVRNSRQARAMAKGTELRPAAAGSRVAKRRGRRLVSPGRGRRARAAARTTSTTACC
jgi:hypothetical protein